MMPVFIQAKVSLDRTDDFLRNVRDLYFSGRLFDILPCLTDGVIG